MTHASSKMTHARLKIELLDPVLGHRIMKGSIRDELVVLDRSLEEVQRAR